MVELFLAVVSGLGVGFAFLYPGLSFLVWISLIPLFFLLPGKISFRKAIFFFLFGLIYYGLVIHWIVQVTFLGFVFLLFYLALFYFLFYVLGSFFIKRPFRYLTIPAAWVLIEFLKENIWCGFGWANLVYSQFRNLYLIQIADLGGAKLVSFFIVLVNFLIWELIVFYKDKKEKRKHKLLWQKATAVFFIFALITTYSFYRLQETGPKEKINVSLIQPNVIERHRLSLPAKEEAIKSFAALLEETPADNLVIFSEAAWPYTLGRENIGRFIQFGKESQRNVLIGAINYRNQNYYNSAFFFKSKENLKKIYDKIILVPFGEYVPWRRYLTFIEVLNQMGDITPGRKLTEFSYKGKKFAVLICFEDIVPLFAARAASGKDFLVNITDDSWFGGNPEATQHWAIMVLRAIENRVSFVRAANTGISGWVSPKGQVEKLEARGNNLFVRAKEDFTVSVSRQRSFYNHKKELLPFFSFIFLIIIALGSKKKNKREG